ncbi:hypothetical protein R1sor_006223 [Riccia sorocarpa]|uniref:Uncharacterized protein n=1 Tax=Riccia sorocarpa TaxID=122646 RepID=A0ABD3HPR5_9MARC
MRSPRNSVTTLAWLDDQAEDIEVRGRTEAPAFAGETSEPHTVPSEERPRPKKFEDDINDDDLCSEEVEVEAMHASSVKAKKKRPGHNERLVTVEDIANDDTISISLPKVEVEQALSKPEYGRLIGKMWEKFAAPAPAKQHVAKRTKVCASNPKVPLVTSSNLKPKDLPVSSSGQAILNYPLLMVVATGPILRKYHLKLELPLPSPNYSFPFGYHTNFSLLYDRHIML